MNIPVHGLHVALDAAGDLADRQRALPCHDLQDLPALLRQRLPEEFDGGKRDMRALGLALEGTECASGYVLAGCNGKGHCGHSGLHSSTSRQKSASSWAGVVKR